MTNTKIDCCRACGCTELESVLSLGNQFVSNFVSKEDIHSGPQCPIELVLCKKCTLVQALYTAPQDFMYSRFYWYRSGVTDTMREALDDIVQAAQKLVPLYSGDVVLDIGSNDGTLLRCYPSYVTTVGVEPATNFGAIAMEGVDVFINDFWSYETYVKTKRV